MSNGKASTRKTDIDNLLKSEVKEREIFGITRRKNSGISSSSVITGGVSSGSSSGGGTPIPITGDNLGNHIATQDLDLDFNFLTNFIGWTSFNNQADVIGDSGIDHYLDQHESYRWRINNGIDDVNLMELTEAGMIFGDMTYGIDLGKNQLEFTGRATPGTPEALHKILFYSVSNAQLSVRSSSGDINPIEKPYTEIGVIIDGGGTDPTAGYKGNTFVPFACEIIGSNMFVDGQGSASVNVYKQSVSEYPSTVHLLGTMTITNGWKTSGGVSGSLVSGDTIAWRVMSATSTERISVGLKVRRLT